MTLGIIFQFQTYGQSSSSRIATLPPNQSNIERYNIDYALKDYIFQNGDSTILNSLDLEYLEHYRLPDSDIDVTEPNTGLTVTLFYEKRKPTPSTLQLKQ